MTTHVPFLRASRLTVTAECAIVLKIEIIYSLIQTLNIQKRNILGSQILWSSLKSRNWPHLQSKRGRSFGGGLAALVRPRISFFILQLKLF